MIEELIEKINDTLEEVDEIQVFYDYPESQLSGYPAVVFFPRDFTNDYDSTAENAKTINFSLFVLQECKVATIKEVFENIMPKTIDSIVAQFDEDWSQGVITGGNRVWWTLASGGWSVVTGQDGEMVQAELTLQVRLNNSI